MKYFILVPDGAAGYPLEHLNGKTTLEASDMPALDRLAKKSLMGLARTIPKTLDAGSDVANLSILGYDPLKYYPGRGPLEAAYHDIKINSNETVFRCNLVTVKGEVLVDYSGGHISNEEAARLIGFLDEKITEIKLYPGVSYRNLATTEGDFSKTVFRPPHDVIGTKINQIFPAGPNSKKLADIMNQSRILLENNPVNIKREAAGQNQANMIWLWGAGRDIAMPSFESMFGKTGAVISAVDLLKGIAKKAAMKVVEVPGATGYLDTDYNGKVEAAIEASRSSDVVMIHVEAPDECGHSGNAELKIRALEDFDSKIIAPLIEKLGNEHYKLLVMPDHYTPVAVKTHTPEPVLFLIYDSTTKTAPVGQSFSEKEAAKSQILLEKGFELLKKFFFEV